MIPAVNSFFASEQKKHKASGCFRSIEFRGKMVYNVSEGRPWQDQRKQSIAGNAGKE